jgi:hypothetical protein
MNTRVVMRVADAVSHHHNTTFPTPANQNDSNILYPLYLLSLIPDPKSWIRLINEL